MKDIVIHWDEKIIWRVMNACFLTGIVLFCGGKYLGVAAVGMGHIIAGAAVLFVFLAADHLSFRGKMIGFAGITVLIAGVAFVVGIGDCLLFVRSYLRWCGGTTPWQEAWRTGYELVQAGVSAFACYMAVRFTERDFRLKAAVAFVLAAALLYALFDEIQVPETGVCLLIGYLLFTYVEWTQRGWKKEKSRSIQAYLLWVTPFMAVYAALLLLSDAPREPYDWRFVKSIYDSLQESFSRVTFRITGGNGESYDQPFGGFSEKSGPRGGVDAKPREIMRVHCENGTVSNVYLTGMVYDTFDGRQWSQTEKSTTGERYMDTVETAYGVKRYDGQHTADYLKYADIEVEYRYFHSRFLFAPLKPLVIMPEGRDGGFGEKEGSLLFDRARGFGAVHRVSYYEMNMGQENFEDLLNTAENLEEDEETLNKLLVELKRRTGQEIDAADMARRRDEIADCYTQEMVLSGEMQAYLDEITEGAQTGMERLREVEKALSSFHYTLTPGELPERVTDGAEFLDYFLLQSRQGYCSHFATAFVLLARAEGYPARYVQGYCVPLKGEEVTSVYLDMAHAWPEVYVNGMGWIPFEPTPGYGKVRYSPWAVQGQWAEHTYENAVPRKGEGTGGEGAEQEEEPDALTQQVEYTIDRAEAVGFLKTFAALGLVLFGAAAVVFVLSRLTAGYRYRKMSTEEKFRTEVYGNMQILSLLGIGRKQETLEEFRIRAEGILPEKGMLRFLEVYEEILYGGKTAEEEMIAETKKQQRELALLLKKKRRWVYLYYRMLKG